ncbi:MAG: tetratricopeptide repeat protein [Fimbriimonadales bacterium]
MRRVAVWCLALLGWSLLGAHAQPIVLVYQERAAPIEQDGQKIDPNISLQPYLVPFLRELRKVQVEWYQPDHPIAQQFAQQRRIPPERLSAPSPELLAQLARAWRATYVLRLRCVRAGNQFEYRAELWQLGRRNALWQTEGFQGGGTASGSDEPSLQSLARTLAMRLDNEVWQDLATTLPAPTPPPPPTVVRPEAETPPQNPMNQLETLLRDGRWAEAILPLRTLIHRNPTDPNLRLQLVQLYQRLNQPNSAHAELESALQLMPQATALHMERAKLWRSEGKLSEAINLLHSALQIVPNSEALQSALIETLVEAGRTGEAESALNRWQSPSAERAWCAYLVSGATRRFEPLPAEPVTINTERMSVWLLVVSGAMTDMANELLELRQQSRGDAPSWRTLQSQAEQLNLRILRMSAWLDAVRPTESLRQPVQRLRFSAQLLSQSAQYMARYLLQRRSEDEERASLLRLESLRELEAVRQALSPKTP